jgi:2-methylcitrate dehydratase PrpD
MPLRAVFITAAHLARCGFVAPTRPYEGRFGLFESHLHEGIADHGQIVKGLGEEWRFLETAIKPYPVCHFIHGCLEAALELHGTFSLGDLERVMVSLPAETLAIVAEPAEAKQHAATEYEAKFSAQFVVAKALLLGRFGLAELTPAALSDPATQALATKVLCRVCPSTKARVRARSVRRTSERSISRTPRCGSTRAAPRARSMLS